MKLTLLAALSIVALQNGMEAQSFRGLGNFSDDLSTRSGAEDVSPDGRVVVGVSNGRAFRWTLESGLQPLGFYQNGEALVSAFAVSADGSVAAGGNESPAPERNAFRWTAEAGTTLLAPDAISYGMTTDGRVVVGSIGNSTDAFRWSEETGLRVLPRIGGGGPNEAFSISDDGRLIAGRSSGGNAVIWVDGGQPRLLGDLSSRSGAYDVSSGGEFVVGYSGPRSGAFRDEAFIWSENTGMVALGDLPGGEHWSGGLAVAADGQTVVGFSKDGSAGGGIFAGFSAFLWTPGMGMRTVKTELESYGIDLTGWHLTFASGITNDGQTIVGRGVNPRGFEEAWIATIPEPSALGLLSTAFGGLLLGFRMPRR